MSSLRGSAIPLFKMKVSEKGRIKDIKEIIVRITGLPSCLNGQIVDLGEGVKGIIMGFDEEDVLALVLGDPGRLRMGREVIGINEPFQVPVGEGYLGRIITALGVTCDQKGDVEPAAYAPVFYSSPSITAREPLNTFLPCGTKIVDIMFPLTQGQRQLILGDRMTGKTVVALDAIISQRGRDVVCIYCCVGKSLSGLEKVMGALHEGEALDYSVIMAATDSSPVGEQYLIPFAAASMGNYFAQRGRNVLIVFDDLTKHAWAYRQLSLLLERPPGREAYPGDIFYVQTQLMERAGNFSKEYGGGSMTFLGIAETQQGDLTGYIPSNLASMCDGQVVLSSTIFAEGFRPAIDLLMSLSIVGGRGQPPILKQLGRGLRADYARYSEVVKLSKLQSGLSGEAERIVKRGEAIQSILKQMQYRPVPLAELVILLYALDRGYLTGAPDEARDRFRQDIGAYARERAKALWETLLAGGEMTATVEQGLDALMKEYCGQSSLPAPAAKAGG